MPENDRLPNNSPPTSPAPDQKSASARQTAPSPREEQVAPNEADALYQQGMSAYQRREWSAAMEHFTRLREKDPARPGLDALLDEVRWFLQLEAIGPQEKPRAESVAPAPSGRTTARWLVALLAVVGIVLVAVAIMSNGLLATLKGDNTQTRARELNSIGQSTLTVGDYASAKKAFQEILMLLPGDPQAQAGLERAQKLETLAQKYQEAQDAIAQGKWDIAAARLAEVRALEPGYEKAAELAGKVGQQQRLTTLFTEAARLYDLGQWEQAIAQLEQIRSLDATYRAEVVQEDLFSSYLNDGRDRLARAGTAADAIRQAIERFGSALSIRPFNRPASDERRLANIYLEAVQAFNRQDWTQARARLEAIRAERADYAGGQATLSLYQAYIGQGDAAVGSGNALTAKEAYTLAAALPVPDRSAAERGLAKVALALATATSTVTPTPTLTPTPLAPGAVIRIAQLNVRQGPGLNYPVIGTLRQGDKVNVLGRTAKSDWFLICCLADGGTGWVSATLVEPTPAATVLPVVSDIPPSPTRQPTGTPTPTPVPPTPVPPTQRPADTPAASPTSTPTLSPTFTPTLVPPTSTPTVTPTDSPTPPPTDTPTPVPPTPTPTPPPR